MILKPVKTAAPAKVPAAPLIVPNVNRSAGSTAILEHLARLWPESATRIELAALFAKAENAQTENSELAAIPRKQLADRIHAKMANMESTGYISRIGTGKGSAWTIGPAAPFTGEMGHRPYKSAYVGESVPPRQPDTMKAPEYKPKPWNLRPGSNDFSHCPSLHQGQRRPFTGGYVVVMAGGK